MADITYIPIRQLYPHPDNPRKELGDLSELAASIKENGVYQNLTVIPGHYLNSREYIRKCVDEGGDAAAAAAAWTPKAVWSSEDYTIIIGHRRAAAAQQAGLYELPCAIVEMDEREQMQTMMVENRQKPHFEILRASRPGRYAAARLCLEEQSCLEPTGQHSEAQAHHPLHGSVCAAGSSGWKATHLSLHTHQIVL